MAPVAATRIDYYRTSISAIMHSMDWDDLRVFLAIARAGRLSIAARQLGVEHTTIARRLGALERDLGVPLFYRTAAGYRLTPHGEAALGGVQAMERSALAVGARAREGAGQARGRVRIALLEEYAAYWLAPRLPIFRSLYPEIELEILVGIQKLDLSRGEAELAIRAPRPREEGLVASRLGRATTGLYASKALLERTRFRLDDDASSIGVPFLVFTPEYHALQSAAWFQPILARATIALRSNDTVTLLAAARASAGVAVLPRLVADTCPDLVSVSQDLFVDEFWLVTHPAFRRDPKVRATADFLKREAASNGGRGFEEAQPRPRPKRMRAG
jgi:DNA-binding transcriptional LysR family regulator